MKIGIVGGGIAGLATYLNLQKHFAKDPRYKENVEITIYESHDFRKDVAQQQSDVPSAGGGYGLAPNGMASLRRLDPEIHDQIVRSGFPTAKTWLRSARGWTLGCLPFNDLRGDHPEACVMVLREIVIKALYERVPSTAFFPRRVTEVEDGENEATVTFQSGEKETFDLVIGADGVWSRARRAILGDKHGAEYKGLFTIGGFVSTDHLPPPPETGVAAHTQTVMTFGPNGFFGYTPYTTGEVPAIDKHLRGEATLPPGKMAFWWSRSAQKDPQANPDDAELKNELRKRHESWNAPTIHKIIANSDVPLKIPTWVLPKLPTWAGKRVVLVGDAAHALPSSSGQGVSQTLEDAEAFSLLLAHNLDTDSDNALGPTTLDTTFKQYMQVRKAHVEKILDAGNRFGDTSREMNVVAEVLMYAGFWAVLKIFGPFFLKTIQNYDVLAEVEKVKRQK